MQADNFEYDGHQLLEFGLVVCEFDSSSGVVVESGGSNISFKKVAHNGGKRFSITGASYEECITATFDVCKDPDTFSGDDQYLTDLEYRSIARWLNRRKFCKTRFMNGCSYIDDSVYYNASFNYEKIIIGDRIIGMRLKMETDSPFGRHEEVENSFVCDGEDDEKVIMDTSDCVGTTNCIVKITVLESGNLTLTNKDCGKPVVIKNCTAGEIITINGDSYTISSSLSSHKLAKDFNFAFFCIRNEYLDRFNTFTSSLKSRITIRYTPLVMSVP